MKFEVETHYFQTVCRGCRRFTADLPKHNPLFCVICYNKLPILQPAGPRIQPPQLRVVK